MLPSPELNRLSPVIDATWGGGILDAFITREMFYIAEERLY